jgi:hypothetical protein
LGVFGGNVYVALFLVELGANLCFARVRLLVFAIVSSSLTLVTLSPVFRENVLIARIASGAEGATRVILLALVQIRWRQIDAASPLHEPVD